MIWPDHEKCKVLCSLCTFRNQFLTGNFSYSIIKPLVGCSKKKEATLKCDPQLPKWLHQPVQTSKIQKEITAAIRMLEYICSDKSHAKANLKSKSVKCKKKKKVVISVVISFCCCCCFLLLHFIHKHMSPTELGACF